MGIGEFDSSLIQFSYQNKQKSIADQYKIELPLIEP